MLVSYPNFSEQGILFKLILKRKEKIKTHKNPAHDKKSQSYLAHTLFFYYKKRREKEATNW